MSLQESKSVTFPITTMKDWEQKAEESLKGKKVGALKTQTFEGIELQPLYTKESLDINEEFPGFAPFTRGINALGYKEKPWLVTQNIPGNTADEIMKNFDKAVERGQNTVSLSFNQLAIMEEGELLQFLQNVSSKDILVFSDTKGAQKAFLSQVKRLPLECKAKLTGVMAEDPITEGVLRGKGIKNMDTFFSSWMEQLHDIAETAPHLKTILVKSSAVHNAGGNAVQELAYSLAVGVEYLQQAYDKGFSVENIAELMVFSFSIDSVFFMNVAKLRAARRLWSLIGQEYTQDSDRFKMDIHCETSTFTSTLFDPYVNLLRGGNQAFAAIIGGAQSLEIKPYDYPTNKTTDFSERIARNIHLVLKEETLLDKVVDPAGGSYYVESLTNELVEKAWALFLEIEASGGITESLSTGWMQNIVKETYKVKKDMVAQRKNSLIGTNVYPNLEDTVQITDKSSFEIALPYEVNRIEPFMEVRLSEEFEKLRLASLDYKEKQGSFPQVGLICMGTLKSYKPRSDFMKGFLAAGGIEGVEKQCQTKEEANAFMKESHFQHFVICGSDSDYNDNAVAWLESIKESNDNATVYLAGNQKADMVQTLQSVGIKDFITAQSNAITFITKILKDLEVM